MQNEARECLIFQRGKKKFHIGDHVEKISGAGWRGRVVGFYSTDLTPIGYAIESDAHPGSVQIYPEKALRFVETEK